MSEKIPTFQAFWPFYLSQHAVPLCRQLHFVGTCLVIGLVGYAVATGAWSMLLLCPVAGYGFAWAGHFVIEKNRPATFTYPVWSLMGDFKMFGLMLTGKLWTGVPVAPAPKTRTVGALENNEDEAAATR